MILSSHLLLFARRDAYICYHYILKKHQIVLDMKLNVSYVI